MRWINKGLQEHGTQKQHLVDLWVKFSLMMDPLLFYLCLLFTVIMVIVLWRTQQMITHKAQSGAPITSGNGLSCPFQSQPHSLGSHFVFNPLCRPG